MERDMKIGVFGQYLALLQTIPRYGHSNGTRMRSIEWCHFQWPWSLERSKV